MVSYSTFKKTSNSIDRLVEEINKLNNNKSEQDNRFWRPETDKAGNGTAVFRFLPPSPQDFAINPNANPWIRYFKYSFRGPTGKWYINLSPSTLKLPDPMMDYNSKLWNQGGENSPQRKQASAQKRKLIHVSNVYIISDPKNPENEGQVKLFAYGKKIFDKVSLAMNPEFEGDRQVNPFDMEKGANFKLRIRQVEGYANYDLSAFEEITSRLKPTDEELDKIWKAEHSLLELISPDKFKSYEQLHRELIAVMGFDPLASDFTGPVPDPKEPVKAKPMVEDEEESLALSEEDMDELARFKALADD